jgi:hypothetical protein
MLNSVLVEQFGAIHRQKRSGVLTVVSATFRIRFCFQDGDPVGIDFCTDKELVIASTLLEFHKIGQEFYQHAVESRKLGKGTVSDIVRRQQVVNEDELAQVTRAMVEDTLVRCFSNPHQELVFDDADLGETFDFDTSAVRLRIGTGVLLNTVQSRVADIDRIIREVGSGEAVFALAESESGSAPLSEFEKHVLNFIDGRKTVEDVAVAFRESTLNMMRMLHGMVAKGAIRRISTGVSRIKPAVSAASTEVAPAAPPAAEGASVSGAIPRPDFVPYRHEEPARSNRALVSMLLIGLALVAGVWVLVIISQKRNQALDSASQALVDHMTAKRWAAASEQIATAKAAATASNDLEAIRAVESLQARFSEALAAEHQAINKLIMALDFPAAKARSLMLPTDAQSVELNQRLAAAEAAFKERGDAVLAQVSRLLDDGRVAEAQAAISRASGRDGEAAAKHLERWRLLSLERASSATMPLSQRVALVSQVLAANPTDHQREQIARISGDFARLQQRTAEQVHSLKKQSEQGAFAEVAAEWERLRIIDQVRGTPLAREADAVNQANESIRTALTRLQADGLSMVRDGNDAKAMGVFAEQVQQALAKWPQASNAALLQSTAQLLSEISGLVSERGASEEATAFDAWMQERNPAPEIIALLKARTERLRMVETAAQDALERARAFLRQNEWDQAQRALEDLLARPEWLRTAAHASAQRELGELAATKGQQQAWQEELRQALLRGDGAVSQQIAQRMGLKYLPLLVQSQPAGGEVWRDGAKLGVTPLIIDIPAGERGGMAIEVRKPGFTTLTMTGAEAEGGWRLVARLVRVSAGACDLAMTVTAKPTAIADKLWLANREQVAVIAIGGAPASVKVERIPLGSTGGDVLGQPLYAGPVAGSDAVYFPTREGMAIRLVKSGGIERIALEGRTDVALAIHTSELITGRRYLVTAGTDGVLRASDERFPTITWTGPAGAPFAAPPAMHGDLVVAVRRSGQIDIHQGDDGKALDHFDLGAPVLAAWVTDRGLAGFTANAFWQCDGKQPVVQQLPQEATTGGPGVFVTADSHAFVLVGEEWKDLGRFEGRLKGEPLAWNGHAVLPLGPVLAVVGAQGFTLANPAEFLSPAVVGGQLAVVSLNGQVRFFSP